MVVETSKDSTESSNDASSAGVKMVSLMAHSLVPGVAPNICWADTVARVKISLVVNGETVERTVEPTRRLIDVLRDDLGLTGTKDSCGRGDCGACTVLIDDRPVLACLTLAARVDAPIRTIEGLAAETVRLREALADNGGLQCGYCTPGMVVRCAVLESLSVGTDDLRDQLAGNFCRCTGYSGVLAALHAVEV